MAHENISFLISIHFIQVQIFFKDSLKDQLKDNYKSNNTLGTAWDMIHKQVRDIHGL